MIRLDQRKLIQFYFFIHKAQSRRPQAAGLHKKNKAAGRRIVACIMWEYPIQ